VSGFGNRYSAFDRFQQRRRWLGFPLAVLQKYGDDQGGYLAATITYYGFFAIFPLLLVLTTVLGQVKSAPNIELHGDELSRADESTLYHHYQLNYTPPDTERGRRLARR
jgi:uncharacterized BrkB/YihY/UPF0761 family membrane protein